MTGASLQEVPGTQDQTYQVRFTVEDGYFEASLFDRHTRVGYVRCMIDFPDEMTLCDVTVFPDALVRRNFLQQVWDRLRREYPKRKSYQGRGLGTLLLKMAIDEARRRKVKRIVGTIVSRDIAKNPKLTEWYARHGFAVAPAEPGNLPGAIYRIARNMQSG